MDAEKHTINIDVLPKYFYLIKGDGGRIGFVTTYKQRHSVVKWLFDQNKTADGTPREIAIMKGLDHPFVMQLCAYHATAPTPWLMMDYMAGGDLHGYVSAHHYAHTSIPTDLCLRIALSIAKGMQYLHQQMRIIHCDLKPDNIFVGKNFAEASGEIPLKIGDFGLSQKLPAEEESIKTRIFMGTLQYMAPELILKGDKGEKEYSQQTDMYAFVCMLYFLLQTEAVYAQVVDWFPFEQLQYVFSKSRYTPEVINPIKRTVPSATHKLMAQSWIQPRRAPINRPSDAQMIKALETDIANPTQDSDALPDERRSLDNKKKKRCVIS